MWNRGCVHLYTGAGKGKTTAAIGLTVRAAGAGLPCFFLAFMKGLPAGEYAGLTRLYDMVTCEHYGLPEFYHPGTDDYIAHRAQSRLALDRAAQALDTGTFRLVVLDEIINALHCNLITFDELLDLLARRQSHVELVLTGRDAPESLYEHCDLITECREIRHYYHDGVQARQGIEF
jgi:cob(I)alamin adenosyltransferase